MAFYLFGYLDGFGYFYASFESVFHVVLDEHGHASLEADFLDFVETHAHEAHSVGECASVFVVAMVGVGAEELGYEVAVTCVYFDGVKAALVA